MSTVLVIEQFVLLATPLFMTSYIYSFIFRSFINRLVLSADSFRCQCFWCSFFSFVVYCCWWKKSSFERWKKMCFSVLKNDSDQNRRDSGHFTSIEIMASKYEIYSIAICVTNSHRKQNMGRISVWHQKSNALNVRWNSCKSWSNRITVFGNIGSWSLASIFIQTPQSMQPLINCFPDYVFCMF